MEQQYKKRLLSSLIFAALVEFVIFLFILWCNISSATKLRIMFGSVAIIIGLLLLYNIILFPYFEEKDKLIKYTIIANPSLSMIFAGTALLFWDQNRFYTLFLIAVVGKICFFLIGFVLLLFLFMDGQGYKKKREKRLY